MEKSELNSLLSFIKNPKGEIQIILYAYLKDNNIKKLDIDSNDLLEIRKLFVESVNIQIVDNDCSIMKISSADDRNKCIYEYDLELPEEFNLLKSVIGNDNIEKYSLKDGVFLDIEALIIILADNEREVSLYKKLYPIEILGKSGYFLGKSDIRFKLFKDQLLRISSGFQVLHVNGNIFIIDLTTIERSFGIQNVIQNEAKSGIKAIKDLNIINNIETLEELINDINFARKLTKIFMYSPVINNKIPNNAIIKFSQEHLATKNKFRYTEDNTQFILDTKVSKDLFIKIMNDDLLTSQLTNLYYETLAKNKIENNN